MNLDNYIPGFRIPDASFLVPHIPHGFDAWESFITVLLLVAMKFLRGWFMKTRSSYVDRFGWAIIIFDWVFACVFATSLIWSLYPGLRPHSAYTQRILVTSLLVVTAWQLFEIITADLARVEAAASGATNGHTPHNDDVYNGKDRRRIIRRKADREPVGLPFAMTEEP